MLRRVIAAVPAVLLHALGLSACLPLAPVTRTVTFSVTTDGAVTGDVNELARLATSVYASPRGWRAAGIEFVRVDTGGDFTLVLANPARLPSYDPVCTISYSCQAGRYVVINDVRYQSGSPAWPDRSTGTGSW